MMLAEMKNYYWHFWFHISEPCIYLLYSFVYILPLSQRIASMTMTVESVRQLVERQQKNALYVSSRRLDMGEGVMFMTVIFIQLCVTISQTANQVSE